MYFQAEEKLTIKLPPQKMPIKHSVSNNEGCPGGLAIKNLPANTGDSGDVGSITGSGRSPGVGSGNPLQYSCPDNPMDRGAWWDTVYGGLKMSATTE